MNSPQHIRAFSYDQSCKDTVYFTIHYHGCSGATCREMMSLQPAPRAQITSWPTGSVALLQRERYNNTIHETQLSFGTLICWYMIKLIIYSKKTTIGSTCRLQPAELGSSSWPARGSDPSAGWGSVKSSVSAGCFLWPLAAPPDPPPDSHLDADVSEGRREKTDRAEEKVQSFSCPSQQHFRHLQYRTKCSPEKKVCGNMLHARGTF